ncbi:GNAT family N-acetyltransferase [Fictibacillus sp. NRS-1165]|uniref:GNAT family N-acetyltransferase n=1 Tax=Fictibacillus sp. NRS-1165 TaxID=3144463 RepID=UPI003D22C666
MLDIKEISAEQTYEIRHKVLRPNQTLDECQFPGDNDQGTFHLGAYQGDKLISIASFYRESHPDITGSVQYRLRGMATLEDYRKEKAGGSLLLRAEDRLRKQNADSWWCNAREGVAGYYKKLGLRECGDVFDLPPIGPHIVMFKMLT